VSQKKQDTILLSVTSPNVNRFQNSFTVRLSRKFVTKTYLNTPPHPKRVATLPYEISMTLYTTAATKKRRCSKMSYMISSQSVTDGVSLSFSKSNLVYSSLIFVDNNSH